MSRDEAELAVRYLEATKNDQWQGLEYNRAAASNIVGIWAHQRVQEALALDRLEQGLKASPPEPPAATS